jgi:hypothetical protein
MSISLEGKKYGSNAIDNVCFGVRVQIMSKEGSVAANRSPVRRG